MIGRKKTQRILNFGFFAFVMRAGGGLVTHAIEPSAGLVHDQGDRVDMEQAGIGIPSVRFDLHHCFVDLMSRYITLHGLESVSV